MTRTEKVQLERGGGLREGEELEIRIPWFLDIKL